MVIVIGEALADLQIDREGRDPLRAAIGGSGANTAVRLARAGIAGVRLCCRIGDDPLGRALARGIEAEGVDVSLVARDPRAPTGVVLLTRDIGSDGRSFWAYREGTADLGFGPADVPPGALRGAGAVHVCADPMRREPGRQAILAAARAAAAGGALVTADLNLRAHLWASEADARRAGLALAAEVHVVKCNHREAELVTGRPDVAAGAELLLEAGVDLAVVTRGADGCVWRSTDSTGSLPAVPVESVDATGAGDAFSAALLAELLDAPRPFSAATVRRAVEAANAQAGRSTATVGAL